MNTESTARKILADNGCADPHPALLEDTMREVEYHGVEMPEYHVAKQEFELECEHYACDLMHRHLYNASYDKARLIDVYNMQGEKVGSRWETRYHMKQVTRWAVVGQDGFAVDSFDTRREAKAEVARLLGQR